jgi:hypothetical protein
MFGPPKMFLRWYDELCYQIYVYKERLERPIRKTKKAMDSVPINDVGAMELKEKIDEVLLIQEKRISKYLAEGEELKKSIDNVCYPQSKRIRKFMAYRDEEYKQRTGYPDNLGVEG